jgi:hypothetical protein
LVVGRARLCQAPHPATTGSPPSRGKRGGAGTWVVCDTARVHAFRLAVAPSASPSRLPLPPRKLRPRTWSWGAPSHARRLIRPQLDPRLRGESGAGTWAVYDTARVHASPLPALRPRLPAPPWLPRKGRPVLGRRQSVPMRTRVIGKQRYPCPGGEGSARRHLRSRIGVVGPMLTPSPRNLLLGVFTMDGRCPDSIGERRGGRGHFSLLSMRS